MSPPFKVIISRKEVESYPKQKEVCTMGKELIIRADELDNANDIVDFFKGSEFDVKLITEEIKSMSGLKVKINYIKITRKG